MNATMRALTFSGWLAETANGTDSIDYKNDPNYGYGEGESQDQMTARSKSISAAKLDLLKKSGRPDGSLVGVQTIDQKVARTSNGAYRYVTVIKAQLG